MRKRMVANYIDLKEEKWLIDFVIWNLSPQMVSAHAFKSVFAHGDYYLLIFKLNGILFLLMMVDGVLLLTH